MEDEGRAALAAAIGEQVQIVRALATLQGVLIGVLAAKGTLQDTETESVFAAAEALAGTSGPAALTALHVAREVSAILRASASPEPPSVES